jgi:hypothetical protein
MRRVHLVRQLRQQELVCRKLWWASGGFKSGRVGWMLWVRAERVSKLLSRLDQ